jgi:pyruvate dehydrogenase E1 component alpha subunit
MAQMTTDTHSGAGLRKPRTHRVSESLPGETLIKWLRDMLLIREFENAVRCRPTSRPRSAASATSTPARRPSRSARSALEHDDPIVTAYRDHGHALARGMDPGACMAEMFGKITGCAKGKGGSMHMFDKPNWLFGGHGIVGAQTPLGTGLAFAARYEWEVMGKPCPNPGVPGDKAKKKVSLAFLGDGALNQGALHEAMNLAGLYSHPGHLRRREQRLLDGHRDRARHHHGPRPPEEGRCLRDPRRDHRRL